jgi:hypothetical protein
MFQNFGKTAGMTNTALQPFAILTGDHDWIARNHATPSPKGDGRVIVMLPASEVERHAFAGTEMLRHVFADVPDDQLNAAVACPVRFVS